MAKKTPNPHVATATKAFGSWGQAEQHAKQLLSDGEISKADYAQIKRQTSSQRGDE